MESRESPPLPENSTNNGSSNDPDLLTRVKEENVVKESKGASVDEEDDLTELLDSALKLVNKHKYPERQGNKESTSPRFEKPLDDVIKEILSEDTPEEFWGKRQSKSVHKKDKGVYIMRLDRSERSLEWRTLAESRPAHQESASHTKVDILCLPRSEILGNQGHTDLDTVYSLHQQENTPQVDREAVNGVNLNVLDAATRYGVLESRPKTRRGCVGRRTPLLPSNDNQSEESSGDSRQPVGVEVQYVGTSDDTQYRPTENEKQRSMASLTKSHEADEESQHKPAQCFRFIRKKWTTVKKRLNSFNCFSCSSGCY